MSLSGTELAGLRNYTTWRVRGSFRREGEFEFLTLDIDSIPFIIVVLSPSWNLEIRGAALLFGGDTKKWPEVGQADKQVPLVSGWEIFKKADEAQHGRSEVGDAHCQRGSVWATAWRAPVTCRLGPMPGLGLRVLCFRDYLCNVTMVLK